jgi:hypothetical protein
MTKLVLPPIVDSAKRRPLSLDPQSGSFIYYDDVEKGKKKITPIEKLKHEQLLKLAIERQVTNKPSITATLNGQVFTNEQLAREIGAQSKIGKQMFNADIEYLKFYLSQFPQECFTK